MKICAPLASLLALVFCIQADAGSSATKSMRPALTRQGGVRTLGVAWGNPASEAQEVFADLHKWDPLSCHPNLDKLWRELQQHIRSEAESNFFEDHKTISPVARKELDAVVDIATKAKKMAMEPNRAASPDDTALAHVYLLVLVNPNTRTAENHAQLDALKPQIQIAFRNEWNNKGFSKAFSNTYNYRCISSADETRLSKDEQSLLDEERVNPEGAMAMSELAKFRMGPFIQKMTPPQRQALHKMARDFVSKTYHIAPAALAPIKQPAIALTVATTEFHEDDILGRSMAAIRNSTEHSMAPISTELEEDARTAPGSTEEDDRREEFSASEIRSSSAEKSSRRLLLPSTPTLGVSIPAKSEATTAMGTATKLSRAPSKKRTGPTPALLARMTSAQRALVQSSAAAAA